MPKEKRKERAKTSFDDGAREWLKVFRKPECLPVEFVRLIAAWEAFNRYYRNRYSNIRVDCRAIAEFASTHSECWREAVNTRSVERKVAHLVNLGSVFDMWGACPGSRGPSTIEDPRDLQQVVRHIYRIRCNLFHGGKQPKRKQDREIADAAAAALVAMIDCLNLNASRG